MTRNLSRAIRTLVAPAAVWLATLSPVNAQDFFDGWGSGFGFGGSASCGTCAPGCQTHHCPPALSHCQERPPCIRVKCGCPKPICNPCNQPGWGYYETCWSPFPFPPNYNHCAVMPPAATIALAGPNNPEYTGPRTNREPLGQMPPQTGPLPNAPIMPPASAPSLPMTPMPRMAPTNPMPPMQPMPPTPMPQTQPMPIPGGGIDSLPVPRPDVPPRPLPNPGGY